MTVNELAVKAETVVEEIREDVEKMTAREKELFLSMLSIEVTELGFYFGFDVDKERG